MKATATGAMWLAALIDPGPVALNPPVGLVASRARGFAFLADGRFGEYQRHSDEHGWPAFGSRPDSDDPEARLLAAFMMQLGGEPAAAERLAQIARADDAANEVAVVAAVLAAVALRDAARPDLAVEILGAAPSMGDLTTAIKAVHGSLALFELGRYSDAVAMSLRGEQFADRAAGTNLAAPVMAVGRRNTGVFAFSARQADLVRDRRLPAFDSVLGRVEARAVSGLSSFVDQEFAGRFEEPGAQAVSYRREDPVEAPLIASLLRAELLGDWSLLQDARKRLGRYQLLASLGVSDRQPTAAFHLLRRASDAKSLARAISWYRAEGPLAPLREFGERVLRQPWLPTTVQADLASIQGTADLIGPDVAAQGLDRILGSLEDLLAGLPTARLTTAVFGAVAGLLGTSPSNHDEVARRLVELLDSTDDPATVQDAMRVVRAIDWTRVSETARRDWVRYGRANLARQSDHTLVASALIGRLDDPELSSTAIQVVRTSPNLLSAVNALRAGSSSESLARACAKIAASSLASTRESAREGKHSLGSYVDASGLLTRLLLDHPGLSGWRTLISFVTDRNVAVSARSSAIEQLADEWPRVPRSAQSRLVKWVRQPVHFPRIPLDPEDEFRGAILRLRFASQARSADQLLADLIDLATSPNRDARHQASRTLSAAAGQVPAGTLLTLGLTLSRDAAYEVRGSAVASLPRLTSLGEEDLASLIWARLERALREPGVMLPLAALRGLAQSHVRLPESTTRLVGELRAHHESASVREAAGKLLGADVPEGLSAPPTTLGAAPPAPA